LSSAPFVHEYQRDTTGAGFDTQSTGIATCVFEVLAHLLAEFVVANLSEHGDGAA